MTTDQELLELAAKAAGIDVSKKNNPLIKYSKDFGFEWRNFHGDTERMWNPLASDGDALRLAVRLGIDLLFTAEDIECVATQFSIPEDQEMLSPWAWESWALKTQDPYAATRRAIVRAAAEIGRGMK